MKTLVCLTLPIFILFAGCASISKTLSKENTDDYDFRNTRWGDSRQRVLLAEKDMQVYQRTDDVLIYRTKISGLPALLIYTFNDNKLRAAGYITEKPIKNAQKLTKLCAAKHGEPTERLKEGLVWKTPDTAVFTHAYPSHITFTQPIYERTHGSLVSHVVRNFSKIKTESVDRWDGVWSYIDADFYNEQQQSKQSLQIYLYTKNCYLGLSREMRTFILQTMQVFPSLFHRDRSSYLGINIINL